MRINKKSGSGVLEGDLTPMIDMTFQLIAFFMVLINFAQTEANDKVVLPQSVLAKPPSAVIENAITVHLGVDGTAVVSDQESEIDGLTPVMNREINSLRDQGLGPADANIIIRAHKDAPTGKVQKLILKCQSLGFEQFALRAENVRN
ncbi:ExbD/TolR family protein [Lignipirellula cremea]|uniref:Biopolymer transport protein ExbD/TolR n=1 Tax=Lignipirellula cremea TaxID=2528010 RepID=A0A518E271_9BACT|nr:biopolymer transporter ExbD [Lignipirellula cremea]QDU98189.1 Biopolymer transport protein ExbD/TolR [Lignipirellula cremea]